MEIDEHITAIDERATLLGAAARDAGLDTPVPTCPDWLVRDLVAHQGGVHRWAAWHVTTASESIASDEITAGLFAAPDDDALIDWFAEGHTALVDALRGAPADLMCFAFLPAPSPLAFWARRQAHETTIHCVDAEEAANRRTAIAASLAVDGIEELLFGFYARKRSRLVADPPVTLGIATGDTGDTWTIRVGPERRVATRGLDPADCTIRGTAEGLYRWLWNRAEPDEIDSSGDPAVLDLWRSRATVTWS